MPGHRKRRQFKQTDAFTRGMVIGLKRAGWSIRQIAADTHLGASTVHRLWRRWLEQGNVAIYRNVGATRVTSARVDRRLLRQAVAAPQATCTAILQHVQDTLDHFISTRTISRRWRQRLEWCRARSTWMTEWHRVVFSDESRFCLSSDSRRVRVWRRRGERSNPAAIVERPTVRQRGINDTLMMCCDRQQALQDVQMLPWPPYSPDLSPIEHVWDIIGRRLHALPQPRSEDELWQMVEREWRAIPQDAIRTLIDSLPRRVAACIAVRGIALLDHITLPSQLSSSIKVILAYTTRSCKFGFGELLHLPTTDSSEYCVRILNWAEAMEHHESTGSFVPLIKVARSRNQGRLKYREPVPLRICGALPRLQPAPLCVRTGQAVQGANSVQLSRINGHVLIGLASKALAERIIEEGLIIENTQLKAFLFRRSTWDLLSKRAGETFILLNEDKRPNRLPSRLDIRSKEKTPIILSYRKKKNSYRYLVVTAKRHREMTAIQLSNELSSATGTRISRQTVYRRLHEGALYARRPMVCIPLTFAHRRARLNWCLEHHAWTHDQWANVLFSDESRFSLNTDSRRGFIWREPGKQLSSQGTLTAQRYRDEILEPYLRPHRDQIGHNLILMEDNTRPHRARLVNEYLQSENIRRMDWPARSPDLNPIEHVWDALGRRIRARHPSPRTLVELRTALLEEWG
ncbi:hypothetical protein LAZ67_X000291 [Cordylochernes scorpioides]|uniref:Transposase n=1 Tax=Cordylochernes scorpioides TaxID=51811 RepID=A0ABY6LVH8_9ARAC|nr:hypothetical protein LAZ67_X000291 [Cordylochernes scorpioides]